MKIFVTRKIPEPGLEILRKKHDINVNPINKILSKKEIIRGIKGKEGLLCLLTDQIDRDVIFSNQKLKMIASYAVGYDNIDIKAATKRGIPVSNTPDALTDTTAEMAWALLFSAARRIVEGDKYTRADKFKGWDPMLMHGYDVTNKTLGIVGAGRIGTAFALKSKGFNMKILYVSHKKNEILENELCAEKTDLSKALEKSDYVSLHVPLNKSTYHMIGEKQLKSMKKNTVLINTSRGPIIDEKALIKALKEKWIFAAGLDVYENEPEIDYELKKLDNVILQPHSASATNKTRTEMSIMAAENMIAGLKGEIPPNCVNKEIFNR